VETRRVYNCGERLLRGGCTSANESRGRVRAAVQCSVIYLVARYDAKLSALEDRVRRRGGTREKTQ